MAIDTAEKRKSISGLWLGLIPGVTPNLNKDGEWRLESGWSYSRIIISVNSLTFTIRNAIFRKTLTRDAGFRKTLTRDAGFRKTKPRNGDF